MGKPQNELDSDRRSNEKNRVQYLLSYRKNSKAGRIMEKSKDVEGVYYSAEIAVLVEENEERFTTPKKPKKK